MGENEWNMIEIARLAGVSQATVSRVLNNRGNVAPEKVHAVMDIVRQHAFTPRPRRSPAVRRRLCLGMLITSPVRHLASELLLRTQQSLAAHLPEGAGLVFLPGLAESERVRRILQEQQIAGVLLAGHQEPPQLAPLLAKTPHVWLNSRATGERCLALGGNELAGGLAAQTFADAGCEKLAVIDYPSHNPGLRMRVDGFRFAALRLERQALVLPVEAPEFEDTPPAEIARRLQKLLADGGLRRCGLFCPDDRLTVILHPLLAAHHLQPGKDLLLISCNNQQEALAGLLPRPATIDLSPELTAQMALSRILKLIDGEAQPERLDVVIKPELIPSPTSAFGSL